MTKRKQKVEVVQAKPVVEVPPVDYIAEIDARLCALSYYLGLDKLAPFFLKEGGAHVAEIIVARCRDLLAQMKAVSSGE